MYQNEAQRHIFTDNRQHIGSESGKTDIYEKHKKGHQYETYLHINNFENRRAITKLRTSSHKLAIETGRWNKIPRDQRMCKNCILNKIEDENHLLFECQMYETERKELYNTIKAKLNMDLTHILNYENRIQEIFNSVNLGTLNALGKFIKNALHKRENTICHILPEQYVYYQINTIPS